MPGSRVLHVVLTGANEWPVVNKNTYWSILGEGERGRSSICVLSSTADNSAPDLSCFLLLSSWKSLRIIGQCDVVQPRLARSLLNNGRTATPSCVNVTSLSGRHFSSVMG